MQIDQANDRQPGGSRERHVRRGLKLARRRGGMGLLLVVLLALGPALAEATLRQAPADPSPAGTGAQVVAQGVVSLAATELAWRVSRDVAPPPANAGAETASVGFVYADTGVVLVADEGTGDQVRLAPGEAMFVRDGDRQVRASLGATSADYYAIALAETATASGDDGADFSSGPFPGPGADHDVDLVRGELAVGESAELPAGAAPTLLLMTEGSLDVATVAGDASASLGTGEVAAVTGALVLTASQEAGTYIAAVVGPAVPRLTVPGGATPVTAEPVDEAAVSEDPEPEESEADPAVVAPVVEGDAGDEGDGSTIDETPIVDEPVVEETPAVEEPVGDETPEVDEPVGDETPGVDEPVVDETPTGDDPGDEIPPAVEETVVPGEPGDDSDGDGLSDADEQAIGTDLTAPDSDGDTVSDGDEVLGLGTDPLIADTDEDGALDGAEFDAGTDPLDAASVPDIAATGDSDGDGYPDEDEVAIGSDPNDPDTDDDGLTDGDEVFVYSTGPLNPDNDGDGVLDGDEITNGTDPNDPLDF